MYNQVINADTKICVRMCFRLIFYEGNDSYPVPPCISAQMSREGSAKLNFKVEEDPRAMTWCLSVNTRK